MADPLILRRARPSDAEAIAAIYAGYVRDTIISFETDPPNAATIAGRIAAVLAEDLPWLVAENGAGIVIGYAYAARFHGRHAYRFTVEPSIYLAPEAIGKGAGTKLYTLLHAILVELGYRQAVALIALPNPASVALHQRLGFEQTGVHRAVGLKFDRWIDVGLFRRPLAVGGIPDCDPLPLRRSSQWAGVR